MSLMSLLRGEAEPILREQGDGSEKVADGRDFRGHRNPVPVLQRLVF